MKVAIDVLKSRLSAVENRAERIRVDIADAELALRECNAVAEDIKAAIAVLEAKTNENGGAA
jgi:F0F1-type ATP synthase membrane subunit b/b'